MSAVGQMQTLQCVCAIRFTPESGHRCTRPKSPRFVPEADIGRASATRYGALHGTIASGRVRLVTVGGVKIAR